MPNIVPIIDRTPEIPNTTFKLQIPQERARLLGLSQRALNEGKTNAVVFVTGDQVSPHNHDDVILPSQQN